MRTDKQVLKIFEANPEWIFELARLPSPGKSTLQSMAMKALERVADSVVIPEATVQPISVVEWQFQRDEAIYRRVVMEMVAVQEKYPSRPVRGMIFFGYNSLDPRTEPWTRVVQSFALRELLEEFERDHPRHPLVAVFKPLWIDRDETLEREAAKYYRTIKDSDLPPACRTSLQEVFISWLQQRLKGKGKKEIEIMLLGELPELEETQSGKDLIRIGEERGVRIGEERGVRIGEERGVRIGEERGLEKAILLFLRARHKTVPVALEKDISTLTAAEAERLLQHLPQIQTLDDVTNWINASRGDR